MKKIISILPILFSSLLIPIITNAGWIEGINYVNTNTDLPETGLLWITFNALIWLFKIFVILAVISFVITGIIYFLAGISGNSSLQEKAKTGLAYSILAIFIAFSGLLIMITIVMLIFGGGFLSLIGL